MKQKRDSILKQIKTSEVVGNQHGYTAACMHQMYSNLRNTLLPDAIAKGKIIFF